MTHRRLFLVLLCCFSVSAFAQTSFTKRTDLLSPAKHYSGVAIAVLDMNGDGRDDIARMDQGFRLAIEYQTAPGYPFTHRAIGEVPNGSQWGMCAADIDNNGMPDVLTVGYYDGIKVAYADSTGSAFSIATINGPETFGQGVNLVDINNDGWLDAFVCHDDAEARIFINDSLGHLVYAPQTIDLRTLPPSDDSGNYGSVWSDVDNDGDLDLYIAKCRQGVNDPKDGRRINQFFRNNGDGTFTQDTANTANLRIGAQSWTADFGDIDNDGDFDCFVTNHDVSSQILENDGAGHFTDITAQSGLFNAITGLPIQGVFRDFDNDGFVDILVAGSQHYLFHNNGNKTFTSVAILDNQPMESFALGDLNHDGFQDIYAGYADIFTDPSTRPDALWLNDGNDNHYFGLNLRGVQSNRSAVGTKIFLYSALGVQVREVRSGESYGIMNSIQVHFGLGQVTAIDSVSVHWPSGRVEVLQSPAPDQYLTMVEGTCIIPPVELVAGGSTVFCSGDSVQITAPDQYTSYLWNTGSTEQAIAASQAGPYAVTVTTSEGCTAVSNVVFVVVDPVETPLISVAGDTTFCAGGTAVLTASPASSYAWSTGETSASIEVSLAGSYFVVTQGQCAQFSSAPVTITILDAPLPVPVADTVALNTPATLTASGDQLLWYDAPAAGNLLYTGNPFQTPPLAASTTYWVANNAIYDSPNVFTGMTSHAGSNFAGQSTNGSVIFDCFSPFRLKSVKVYTNKAGMRKIDLRDANATVLASATVNIPVGISVINLNLDVPAGTDLELTTDPVVNQQSLNTAGPQLRRSDQNVAYPYEVPGYLSIKSSNFGIDRYYYFYNWEVDLPGRECLSERVPVTAVVDSTLVSAPEQVSRNEVRLFPNPGSGEFQLEWAAFAGGLLRMTVWNTEGLAVLTRQMEAPSGPLRLPVSLSQLPRGVYILELSDAKQVRRLKIMIQ